MMGNEIVWVVLTLSSEGKKNAFGITLFSVAGDFRLLIKHQGLHTLTVKRDEI